MEPVNRLSPSHSSTKPVMFSSSGGMGPVRLLSLKFRISRFDRSPSRGEMDPPKDFPGKFNSNALPSKTLTPSQ